MYSDWPASLLSRAFSAREVSWLITPPIYEKNSRLLYLEQYLIRQLIKYFHKNSNMLRQSPSWDDYMWQRESRTGDYKRNENRKQSIIG